MKTPLKNVQGKKPIKISKAGQTSKQNPVFSYAVKKAGADVALSQAETGYVLSMKMEQLEDTLCVTRFTLVRSTQLTYLSPELSDAALIEIIVQAFVILLTCAERYEADEILFLLSQEDADLLVNFESFFDNTESLTTREGSKTSFAIYNTWENWEFLREKIGGIKTQLKQGLWQIQREDRTIRNFLQNHQRGTLLPFLTLQAEKSRMGTVIPFPQSRRK